MKLYDELISEFHKLLEKEKIEELSITNPSWEDVGNNNMIFKSDMAYELGAETLYKKVLFLLRKNGTSFLQINSF